jgi:hypothetical protein
MHGNEFSRVVKQPFDRFVSLIRKSLAENRTQLENVTSDIREAQQELDGKLRK